MSRTTDIRVCEVRTDREQIAYRMPMKFGGRVVKDVVLLNVVVTVENAAGDRSEGYGSMTMGNAWGWPSQILDSQQTLDSMLAMADQLAAQPETFENRFGHPLEITHRLSHTYEGCADRVCEHEPMPKLARLVVASPFEAAIHDAFGRLLGQNSYRLLGSEFVSSDLSTYLSPEFAGDYLDQFVRDDPQPKMPLYHLVGALDPLDEQELGSRVNDGLPETLGEWILADGLTHMKLKLAGDDLAWDLARVAKVDQVAQIAQQKRGVETWYYSLDFNEKCPNVDYLLEFLSKVEADTPAAFQRIQYLEQPTHRDLRANPENRMHEAAAIKPVVIDESLVDYESLLLAREQGYSGVALKACKGHSEALLMGAAAQKFGLFLCVQDLTCVGYSFLHSASLAARIPTIAAIEGNGRQYCPAGNAAWQDQYPAMFDIADGTVGTHCLNGIGLGFSPQQ